MDQQSKGVWPNNPGWGEAGRNNEIVLDTRSIEEHLPRVVLAFFEDSHGVRIFTLFEK